MVKNYFFSGLVLFLSVFVPFLVKADLILDDFESGMRSTSEQDLWSIYDEGNSGGTVAVTTTKAHTGNRSLEVTLSEQRIYMQFYTWHINGWTYARSWELDPKSWTQDTYDALQFYVFIPGGLDPNIQLGTYVKGGQTDSWAGAHYYHFFNFKNTGVWEKVILDWHPNHQVGDNYNSNEYLGLRRIGANGEPGSIWTYADGLTRFYFDDSYGSGGTGKKYYFDDFSFITLPADEREAVDETYSLHGAYSPSAKDTYVGWQQYKFHSSGSYSVKYAFNDIHSLGWDNAASASGQVTCRDLPGYNDCEWSTNSIDASGHSAVYIGIKYGSDDSFRQIVLPAGNQIIDTIAPGVPSGLLVR